MATSIGGVGHYDKQYPAYDLGYLLRKLPETMERIYHLTLTRAGEGDYSWRCGYVDGTFIEGPSIYADTPEDAACKLAIELFKQGVLRKDAA